MFLAKASLFILSLVLAFTSVVAEALGKEKVFQQLMVTELQKQYGFLGAIELNMDFGEEVEVQVLGGLLRGVANSYVMDRVRGRRVEGIVEVKNSQAGVLAYPFQGWLIMRFRSPTFINEDAANDVVRAYDDDQRDLLWAFYDGIVAPPGQLKLELEDAFEHGVVDPESFRTPRCLLRFEKASLPRLIEVDLEGPPIAVRSQVEPPHAHSIRIAAHSAVRKLFSDESTTWSGLSLRVIEANHMEYRDVLVMNGSQFLTYDYESNWKLPLKIDFWETVMRRTRQARSRLPLRIVPVEDVEGLVDVTNLKQVTVDRHGRNFLRPEFIAEFIDYQNLELPESLP